MNNFYKDRTNRVIDYIQSFLETDLSLKQLSAVACFSEFHFNRIFKTITKESVYQYIRRLRLEKITEKQKLRVMVAIPVSGSVNPTGSVGVTKISGGKYGVCRFLLNKNEFMEAWDWMFSVWLLNSGYERDNREAFERCLGKKVINGKFFLKSKYVYPLKPNKNHAEPEMWSIDQRK